MQWRTQGGGGVRGSNPPLPEKLLKNDVISEVSIFSNKFSTKIDKKANFPLNFHQKFSKFSQDFQKQLFFVQTRKNLPHGFEISLQNRRKYTIFCNFLQEIFCQFSKILRRPGGSAPRPPTRPDPLP